MTKMPNLNEALKKELNQPGRISIDNIERIFNDPQLPVDAKITDAYGRNLLDMINKKWNDKSIIRVIYLCQNRPEFTPNNFTRLLIQYHQFASSWGQDVFKALIDAGANAFAEYTYNDHNTSIFEHMMRFKFQASSILTYLKIAQQNKVDKPTFQNYKTLLTTLVDNFSSAYLQTPLYAFLSTIVHPSIQGLISKFKQNGYRLDEMDLSYAKQNHFKGLLIEAIKQSPLNERINVLNQVFDPHSALFAFFSVQRGLFKTKLKSGSFAVLQKMLVSATLELQNTGSPYTDKPTLALRSSGQPPSYSEIAQAPTSMLYPPSAPPAALLVETAQGPYIEPNETKSSCVIS
jgi:hypothetical protein